MKHIQGMDDNRLPKKNLNYKSEGSRNIEEHKRDGEMISGNMEQAKGPKPYN